MAWEFKGSDTTGTGPPWTLTEPTSASAGDVLILFGGTNAVAGNYTPPADFTVLDTKTETAHAPDCEVFIAYKIRGADQGSGYSLGYDGASASDQFALICFGDTSASTTADVAFVSATHYVAAGNTINTSAQPVTTSASAALIVLCEVMNGGPPDSFGPPAGYQQATAAAGTVSVYMAYATATAPGIQNPGAFTHANVSADNDISCWTLAFTQAAAAAGGGAKTVIYRRIRGD